MSTLKAEVRSILEHFVVEIADKMRKASPQELLEFLNDAGVDVVPKRDRRGEWWGRLTPAERSAVGQRAKRTRLRNLRKEQQGAPVSKARR